MHHTIHTTARHGWPTAWFSRWRMVRNTQTPTVSTHDRVPWTNRAQAIAWFRLICYYNNIPIEDGTQRSNPHLLFPPKIRGIFESDPHLLFPPKNRGIFESEPWPKSHLKQLRFTRIQCWCLPCPAIVQSSKERMTLVVLLVPALPCYHTIPCGRRRGFTRDHASDSTAPLPPISRRSEPHFLFYTVVSLIRWVIPYKYRKILEMLLKLMKICVEMGSRYSAMPQHTQRNSA